LKDLTVLLFSSNTEIHETFKHELNKIPFCSLEEVCTDFFHLIEKIETNSFDVLFIDTSNLAFDCFEFVKQKSNLPLIVYISQDISEAIKAFEVGAVDFLIFPINMNRLFQTIEKIKLIVSSKNNIQADITNLDSFYIKDKSVYTKIFYKDISYIESMADFCNIVFTDGIKKTVLVNLKNIESQLPNNLFIRISKTHIVNQTQIQTIEHASIQISNQIILIGKTYHSSVAEKILSKNVLKRHYL
jgi:DNA-binding LytR/AlgR family response regulator